MGTDWFFDFLSVVITIFNVLVKTLTDLRLSSYFSLFSFPGFLPFLCYELYSDRVFRKMFGKTCFLKIIWSFEENCGISKN